MVVKAEASSEQAGLNLLSLKVLTLNIHSGVNFHGQYDLDGIAKYIEEVQPDLVGMQEVERGWSSWSHFEDIPGQLAHRLGMFYAYSASLERNNGNFGNLILSRYPIVSIWTELLPGSLERRSFAFAQVMVDGCRVNFVTTHLGLSTSDRQQQAAAIMQFINQLNGPLIVTGDFNGGLDDPAVLAFKDGFQDLQDQSAARDQGTFRLKNGSVSPRIDYIFTSPEFGLSGIRVDDNYISDHLPIVAELNLSVSNLQLAGEPIIYQSPF